MGKGGELKEMGRCICIIQKNGSNIFIHQRLTYKKREGGWVGGWERHKNNKSEENRRRSRGDPDFSSFYLIPPHSIHL